MRKSVSFASLVLTAMVFLSACSGTKEVTNMPYSTTIKNSEVSGHFTGTVEKNVPNGEGTFSSEDGAVVYTGGWQNGAFFGEGTFTSSSTNGVFSYSGNWDDGEIKGKGTVENDEISVTFDQKTLSGVYSGDVVDGLPDGEGQFLANSSEQEFLYDGNWQEGKISGKGTLKTSIYSVYFKDGKIRTGRYSGNVVDGLADGNGVFEATNDEGIRYTYTGEWSGGLFNGYGVQHWDAEDTYTLKGTFTSGEFTPTPEEFFVSRGTYPSKQYEITGNALNVLKEHPDVFENNDVGDSGLEFEEDFKYKAFAKNPSQFGSKLICIPNLKVVQIFENEDCGQEHSFIIAQDGQYNVYYINIYGYCDNVYEGSRIKMTGLPLDYFTYPNTRGQKIWAIACAGVKIE